jgi:hypothetical protein
MAKPYHRRREPFTSEQWLKLNCLFAEVPDPVPAEVGGEHAAAARIATGPFIRLALGTPGGQATSLAAKSVR